jgi:large subunit ribosomal protein L25
MKVTAVLNATSRPSGQSVSGVKGVIYGKELASQAIQIERSELEKVYASAGQNTVVDVLIDGASTPQKTLFQDIQTHPLTNKIIHFDLHAVSLKDMVHADVPIEIIGETQIIIMNEGILTTVQEMVEVESAPMSIPESYIIDISTLTAVNDNVTVGDLPALEGVTILDPPENVLVKIDAIVDQAAAIAEEEAEDAAAATEAAGAGEGETEAGDTPEGATDTDATPAE